MSADTWTDEQKLFLDNAYGNSAKSMSEIQREFNDRFGETKTRNAIIGKVNRLGLREKYKPQHSARQENKSGGRRYWNGRTKVKDAVKSLTDVGPAIKSAKPQNRRQESAYTNGKRPLVSTITELRAPPSYSGPPSQNPVALLELNECTCRWPLGEFNDRPPYMFCGDVPVEGKPYCPAHMAKVIDPNRMQRRKVPNMPSYR